MKLGLLFLITWFTDPPTRFFRMKKKNSNFFFILFSNFFFTNFKLQVPSPDKGGGFASASSFKPLCK